MGSHASGAEVGSQTEPMTHRDLTKVLARLPAKVAAVQQEIQKCVVGQQETVDAALYALLSRGHCLIEGVPGLGKTLLVRALARVLELAFSRVQFTPDLMPADITGTVILQKDPSGHRKFVFSRGPVFTQMLLADEINRTPPKTQAALLEAMQEKTVTVSGHTHQLEEPFFVVATREPDRAGGHVPAAGSATRSFSVPDSDRVSDVAAGAGDHQSAFVYAAGAPQSRC